MGRRWSLIMQTPTLSTVHLLAIPLPITLRVPFPIMLSFFSPRISHISWFLISHFLFLYSLSSFFGSFTNVSLPGSTVKIYDWETNEYRGEIPQAPYSHSHLRFKSVTFHLLNPVSPYFALFGTVII